MKDFIKFPPYVKELDDFHSNAMKNLIRNSCIEDELISLDYIREMYKKDREQFTRIVDELTLRGFTFHTVKPNNILPNNTFSVSSYIEVGNNNDNYKKIDFEFLGLSSLIHRFKIQSDLFFNKVPLEGFKFLNAAIDVSVLEKEFKRVGFKINKLDQCSCHSKKSLELDNVEEADNFDEGSETNTKPLKIKNVFEDNKYNSFRRYCYENGIEYIVNIDNNNIEEYRNQRGVGEGRVKDVKEKLTEIGYSLSMGDSAQGEEKCYFVEEDIFKVFPDNKYKIFRDYCQENNIKSTNEIKNSHLEKFSQIQGVGKKKVEDIKALLKDYSISAVDSKRLSFEGGELYETIKEFKVVSLLKAFDYEVSFENPLRLKEINGTLVQDLDKAFNWLHMLKLQWQLTELKKPQTLVKDLKEVLRENEYNILKYRYGDKLTLQETGELFSLTRERVRQIAKKAIPKVINYLDKYYFHFVLPLYSSSNSLITGDELKALTGTEDLFIIEVLKEEYYGFTYFEKLDSYFFTSEKDINIDIIEEFIEELPNTFYLREYELDLEKILEDLGVEDPTLPMIRTLIEKYDFIKYGDLYSRSKLTIVEMLEVIFKDFISHPLSIYEEGYDQIKEIAKKHLDYDISSNARAIDARLRDSENIMLVDKATYQWFDNESFDTSFVTKINDYIKARLGVVNVINIQEVYEEFEEILQCHEINNKMHLYSIVRYYLDEEFIIGKGNTLNIFNNETDKLSIEDSLLKAIYSLGGICDKNKLKEILRWPLYKIDLGINSSNRLLSWGKNHVIVFDEIGLTEGDKKNLISLTNNKIHDGFVTVGILLKEMKFNRDLAPLVSNKGIDDIGKLSSIIKILMPEISGHSNFLYLEDCNYSSFEEVIVNYNDDETTRKKLRDFTLEYGYKDVMASSLLNKLLEQRSFVEIDVDKLLPASKFIVPNEALNKLLAFVEEKKENKEYISISNLKGYKRRLPDIGFRWNPYLMKTILVMNGYRQITKVYNDYRFDKIVLVKENSLITSFEELVHFVLKNEYNGNMHERDVYDFLMEKGILREQDSPYSKVLPHELKNFDNLVNVDNIGIVTLR